MSFINLLVVHDLVECLEVIRRKQELQMGIERQIEGERLDGQDIYLLEINLEDLERSSGGPLLLATDS